MPMQYTEMFKNEKKKKKKKIVSRKCLLFLIHAQNIDCGYTL